MSRLIDTVSVGAAFDELADLDEHCRNLVTP
jgi:hypothetical protein